jgi:hypothetical protein
MTKIFDFVFGLPALNRNLLSSLSAAIFVYFSAFLSNWLVEVYKVDKKYIIVLHGIAVIFVVTVIFFLQKAYDDYEEEKNRQKRKRVENLIHSYEVCERYFIQCINDINKSKKDEKRFLFSVMGSLKNVQNIINSLYNYFEVEYGKEMDGEMRINFEVTFMTRSYKDNKITIPASANRNGRSPRSMLLRPENPELYNHTVTAQIYESKKPTMVIVENTLNETYNEVYEGQKQRIKSSIVYPVLSDTNELLGTIVVHCDKERFFKKNQGEIWGDIMEVYAKKIALEKVKMDVFYSLKEISSLKIKFEEPF